MSKKIPFDTELVIFDMFDTLVRFDESRNKLIAVTGVHELLKLLKDKKIAVSSDGEKNHIQDVLKDIFGEYYFNPEIIYGTEHLIRCRHITAYKPFSPFQGAKDSVLIKDLGRICRKHSVHPKNAVMIGDDHNGVDSRSAHHFGIEFIQVPTYQDDHNFSFMQLSKKF